MNSVINPIKSHFDPINDVISESAIDGNLDQLFKIESLGITDDSVSDFDKEMIDDFKQGICFKDGKYHVALPWYNDKISLVKPNFNIAKSVLNNVVSNLKFKNIYDAYDAVFNQQLSDDIIEEINLEDVNIYDNVWIPHRPIIKMDELVTTKVRPVLNCTTFY